MKHKKRRILPSLTWRIACLVSGLWLICMYAITSVTAENFYVAFLDMGQDFMDNAWKNARFSEQLDGDEEQLPGYTEYVLWKALRGIGPISDYGMIGKADHFKVLRTEGITRDSVIAVFDSDGNLVAYPGNFFTFAYFYEESDVNQGLTPDGYAVCVLDRQMDPETARFRIEQSFLYSSPHEALSYRFTGVLENGYLTVQKAAFYRDPALGNPESGWIDLPGFNAAMPDGAETVTLYTGYVEAETYTASRSFKYNGTEISDLGQFVAGTGPYRGSGDYSQYSFTDFVYIQSRYYHDWSDWDGTAENMPEMEYKLTTVMLASPWGAAVSALRNVYIITSLIVIAGILWLHRVLKRNVTEPVAAVNRGITEGWKNIREPGKPAPKFTEIAGLVSHYEETRAQLAQYKDTITRLERSVKFTQEAEENRRQMTSNIAHELKTPLAVIHSYAEGLRERIAEDKRDRYLEVIMAETERMDGLVLEMLDLSRLEAGKVKLSREDFSLSELTASVFKRLERAIEAKELKLNLELDKNCLVNADPARIEQVISNLAANAVKYTPRGGKIYVRTTRYRDAVSLAVENESPQLSREALSKVWDTFYRADESRSGGGTGLGLAIVKSILDLHGARYLARNTETGVEFSFTLSSQV